jgi:hypothetical protein
MRRVRAFLRLPPGRRRLYVHAASLDALFRLSLTFLRFTTVRGLARRLSTVGPRWDTGPIVEATSVAGRVVPGSTCLSEALTAWLLLTRGGAAPVLRIGVIDNSRFEAHAWVECDDVTLVGGRPEAVLRPFVGGDVMSCSPSHGSSQGRNLI